MSRQSELGIELHTTIMSYFQQPQEHLPVGTLRVRERDSHCEANRDMTHSCGGKPGAWWHSVRADTVL